MEIPAVIITGARRSGTHLVYRLLDNHPNLFNSLVEVYFLEYLYQLSPKARGCFVDYYFTADLDDLFDVVFERELLPLYRGNVSYEKGVVAADQLFAQVDEKVLKVQVENRRKAVASSTEGIWDSWYGGLQSVMYPDAQIRPTVIKSPDYGKSALGASEFLSTFKVIFIVRNPLFALSSLRKLRSNQPHRWKFTTVRVLSELSSYIEMYQAIEYFQTKHPAQTIVIRFEDLIREPERTQSTLAEFLNIPYDNILLQPTFNGKDWHGDSSFERHTGLSKKTLDPSRLLLTHKEMDMVSTCLSEFLSRYGYDNG